MIAMRRVNALLMGRDCGGVYWSFHELRENGSGYFAAIQRYSALALDALHFPALRFSAER